MNKQLFLSELFSGFGTERTLPRFKKVGSTIFKRAAQVMAGPVGRAHLAIGVQPLSNSWGERGKPIHRYYLEQFLEDASSDIRGRCLEFQEDSYTTRFGRDRVLKLDILNKEPNLPHTTILADLSKDNNVPSDSFDCIICTYVLHVIFEHEKAVSGLHRILKPGGVLLIGVPNITIHYQQYPELWRFTTCGLHASLSKYFSAANIATRSYGNSLTAAGELRGLACNDFAKHELDFNDPRYALLVCARAVKSAT